MTRRADEITGNCSNGPSHFDEMRFASCEKNESSFPSNNWINSRSHLWHSRAATSLSPTFLARANFRAPQKLMAMRLTCKHVHASVNSHNPRTQFQTAELCNWNARIVTERLARVAPPIVPRRVATADVRGTPGAQIWDLQFGANTSPPPSPPAECDNPLLHAFTDGIAKSARARITL